MVLQSLFRRIIDFGSALDEFTMKHYYGSAGPSRYLFPFVYLFWKFFLLWFANPDSHNALGYLEFRAEQTHDYAPPEAIMNSSWHRGPTSLTLKYGSSTIYLFIFKAWLQLTLAKYMTHLFSCRYDMWSVGVVMLEMILGSPNVFDISSVTRALLDQHIRGWSENFKELAYK